MIDEGFCWISILLGRFLNDLHSFLDGMVDIVESMEDSVGMQFCDGHSRAVLFTICTCNWHKAHGTWHEA